MLGGKFIIRIIDTRTAHESQPGSDRIIQRESSQQFAAVERDVVVIVFPSFNFIESITTPLSAVYS